MNKEELDRVYNKFNNLTTVSKDMIVFTKLLGLIANMFNNNVQEALEYLEKDIDVFIKEEKQFKNKQKKGEIK